MCDGSVFKELNARAISGDLQAPDQWLVLRTKEMGQEARFLRHSITKTTGMMSMTTISTTRKRKNDSKLIKFSFRRKVETENKLEPERKIKLAKELGLQPRQIAIWFQNRRARWKTKQLEKDYDTLQQRYNQLKANYDNLIQEKEKLKSKVLDLSEKLLQQETEKGASDSSSTKFPSLQIQQEPVCVNDDQYVSRTSNVECVQDVVSDSSSPKYIDRVQSLLEFHDHDHDQDQSLFWSF
ncbi:hypothetical protein L1987_51733 [Smallanthus sonchifolius]|uniref:Uncharacterized protein n=1 Tax=Smallanthus sonchifolius TaxID=185202 RepID=A0ACB9ES99_9ASTR|nr:hypothetical protein L1987_51733 [Smallanthus sonchifolius]